LGFILASITFVDFATPLDFRILGPILIIVIICAAIFLEATTGGGYVRLAVSVALLTLLVGSFLATERWIGQRGGYGDGFTNQEWQLSETIAALKGLPQDVPIITNGHEPVYVLMGRVVFPWPEKLDRSNMQARPTYNVDLEQVAELIRHGAVLAYFARIPMDGAYAPIADFVARVGPLRATRLADGIILVALP